MCIWNFNILHNCGCSNSEAVGVVPTWIKFNVAQHSWQSRVKNLINRNFWSALWMRNPGVGPLMAKYGCKALNGHIVEVIFSRVRVTPCLNGFVFDYLKVICSTMGEGVLSTVKSQKDRCTSGSYSCWDGTVTGVNVDHIVPLHCRDTVLLDGQVGAGRHFWQLFH